MNRNELGKLSFPKQKAAFRTFIPQKRKQLWIDKFDEIKLLNFSKEELNHLKKFESFLITYSFSKELSKKQEIFLNNWFNDGKKRLQLDTIFLNQWVCAIKSKNSS